MSSANLRHMHDSGVYFISDSSTFSYAATCLADGLDQLGVPVHANLSYHDPLISDFRFIASGDTGVRDTAACVIIDLQDTRKYYEQLIRFESRFPCTVAFCMQDDVGNFCIDGIDALLCAHENRFRTLAGIRVPIAFGLSSAMIRKSQGITLDAHRQEGFLHNFRPSLNQDLRASLDLSLVPMLNRRFPVHHRLTGDGRWNDEYYDLLASIRGCLAYGGTYEQDFSKNEFFLRNERFRNFAPCVNQTRETVILRWDSWRFWESLVFGCLTLHLDFDEYGFMLPVMPENWTHYIGLNLAELHRDLERLMDERKRLPEIAWNGRLWAIQNYSPVAVARRFIDGIQRGWRDNTTAT